MSRRHRGPTPDPASETRVADVQARVLNLVTELRLRLEELDGILRDEMGADE